MPTPTTKTELLKSHHAELIKTYLTYDAYDRVEYVYECVKDTADGGACVRTQYAYDGTSTRITKMKETYSTWSSAYDI